MKGCYSMNHQLAIWMNLCGWVECWGKEMHLIATYTLHGIIVNDIHY